MATSTPSRNPVPPFTARFVFTVDGLEIGAFTEVSGLSVQLDTEDLVEGGNNGFVHKLPKQLKWPNLVLKRGITNSDVLFDWFAKCSGEGLEGAGDKLDRKHGAVALYDATGKVVRKWEFTGAFPVKWTGPKFAAASKDLAIEELEVTHCGFKPSK